MAGLEDIAAEGENIHLGPAHTAVAAEEEESEEIEQLRSKPTTSSKDFLLFLAIIIWN